MQKAKLGKCAHCGKTQELEKMYKGADSELYCKRCFDRLYGQCSVCGETEALKDLYKESGKFYCSICFELANKNSFEIYFDDLNEKCQKRLLYFYNMSDSSERNWDIMPLFVLEKENV